MKKTTFVLFLFFIVTFSAKAQVLITVADNATLEIKNGATLNAGGLELIPDYDYTINGPNHIERDFTAISIDGNDSMARHYEMAEDLTVYEGAIVYNYDDADMNGITHFAALQILDTSGGSWMNYADEDSADYTVTHAFAAAVQIKAVTANDATLSIETVDGNMSISIYPNPTAAILNVKFDKDLELTIYNLLGQQVLKSNSKTLDISGLNDGTYILVTKNLENNTTTNFKIIKN
ncbi:MAG: T9SS type A sorting domain-containing protein [Flavobacteriaceae bacterium]|jgi:hypothetical protein